jgi:hypothetical protein
MFSWNDVVEAASDLGLEDFAYLFKLRVTIKYLKVYRVAYTGGSYNST